LQSAPKTNIDVRCVSTLNVAFRYHRRGRLDDAEHLYRHILSVHPQEVSALHGLALIANLDLLIGVDTCVLHLAGAMGRPAWGLTCAEPAWQWMLDRPDSPWYPTVRLFCQRQPYDWSDVFEQVGEALVQMAGGQPRTTAAG